MAIKLWCYRCELARLTAWLAAMTESGVYDSDGRSASNSVEIASRRIGLTLMVKRSHIAATRLQLTRLRLISHQINQLLGLMRLLMMISRRRRRSGKL
ncbi:hypothetical protein [Synechococcus sp. PCC 7335]|uniref:hypothetical protein n=1 Tax=Synechococcus sp. (strain ATCC 29403 / PCC 7335) TaxID=91464 RepID=UPI0012F973B8|nr:hypothetical protein [Synechococcus sp. PCC 7335]